MSEPTEIYSADQQPALVSTPPLPQLQQPTPSLATRPIPVKQGAWGLWWLVIVTFGIYYYVWYHRINRELAAVTGQPLPANGKWFNQIIPFWNLVGLGATAKRLNAAHAAVGSPTRVGVFTTWFWAPSWFASQTRYLQRRMNILHDVLASHATRG